MTATILRAARWADVDAGEVRSPAVVVVEGERITAVNPDQAQPDSATVVDLGDVTLLPGLMDMELNLFIGGPGGRKDCRRQCTACRTIPRTARCGPR